MTQLYGNKNTGISALIWNCSWECVALLVSLHFSTVLFWHLTSLTLLLCGKTVQIVCQVYRRPMARGSETWEKQRGTHNAVPLTEEKPHPAVILRCVWCISSNTHAEYQGLFSFLIFLIRRAEGLPDMQPSLMSSHTPLLCLLWEVKLSSVRNIY